MDLQSLREHPHHVDAVARFSRTNELLETAWRSLPGARGNVPVRLGTRHVVDHNVPKLYVMSSSGFADELRAPTIAQGEICCGFLKVTEREILAVRDGDIMPHSWPKDWIRVDFIDGRPIGVLDHETPVAGPHLLRRSGDWAVFRLKPD
jgi:hypothetical protein